MAQPPNQHNQPIPIKIWIVLRRRRLVNQKLQHRNRAAVQQNFGVKVKVAKKRVKQSSSIQDVQKKNPTGNHVKAE